MRLHPYQTAGASFLSTRRGALLSDEVGLGKTIQAIEAVRRLNLQKVLLITPKNLRPWWTQQIIEAEGEASVTDLAFRIVQTEERAWILMHYEQFIDNGRVRPIVSDDQVWEAVICDEVHKIKNPKAQRTQNIWNIHSLYRWGLTASPIADTPQDLWGLLHWVAPKIFTSRWRFLEQYTEVEKNLYGHFVVGEPKNLPGLQEATRPYLLRRTREDVGQELPPLTTEDVLLEMTPKQAELYRRMEKQFLVELAAEDVLSIPSALARFTRLHQQASDPTVFSHPAGTKEDWLEDYLEAEGPPAVIMTRYLQSADTIQKCLARANRSDFRVGTFSSLAEGHNLQDWSHLILWDMTFSRQQYEQAVGRVYRQGQTKPVTVLRLLCDQSVDDDVREAVERKQSEADLIMSYLRHKGG